MKSGINDQIASWDELGALPTRNVLNTVILLWIEDITQAKKVTQLRMSAEETNIPEGVRRADDWSETNQKVWFEC